jgi:hypothetical protein
MFFLANKNCAGLALPSGGPMMPLRSIASKQTGGSPISDAQAALQDGSGRPAHFKNQSTAWS